MEICLVGAGPRGLSVLERLCAQERKSPRWPAVTVHVADPDPAGAGRVWRPTQSRHLLMNTVACQVTLYTDASVRIDGPVEEGPSLYQWAKTLESGPLETGRDTTHDQHLIAEARRLGPDTYPTRALYGSYLRWAFQQTVANAPGHLTVLVHPLRAVALEDTAPRPDHGNGNGTGARTAVPPTQTVTLEDGTRLTGLSAVVLAQGHLPARPTDTEHRLAAFAARNGLTYLAPANPADVDLSHIPPGQSVLLRGLGLNFFDYLTLFTQGRGGTYTRTGGRLVYRPSGREPRLYAGSRRGVPYQARGENEKGAHGRYFPRLLTTEYIAALRRRKNTRGTAVDFTAELWPLISKEVCGVYYTGLLTARGEPAPATEEFTERYLRAEPGPAEDRILDEAGIGPAERWDWHRIARPYGPRDTAGPAAFRRWLRDHLDEDVRLARQGNINGPVKAALDVLRDLRNELRLAVDHAGLTAASHRDDLERWYTPLNTYLSIGPPASRIEEMAALMDAGVLDVTGPGLHVATDPHDPCFIGTSSETGQRVRAGVLIEARLPDIDLRRTTDPLLGHLLRTGQCRPYRIPHGRPDTHPDSTGTPGGADYETGGLAVSERPYHLIDAHGVPHPRRFAYGVPTESVHWVTAAGIRPGVGSVTLEDSDAIAAAVLALPPCPPPAPRHDRSPSTTRGQAHDLSV
ncbi:FAD/NAD(P)-binding protein [Streptomyces qinzhouensis]|uniref:FAD/NAD(P)-binding protein n=1 Tax=Streptomyces qinzhouensis TaxID=2599401 RepID=A0A5B8JU40_9ACTN|nr:FAD/NAD(P)-binding protein [Streptomyces qinzhouensis]QDY80665.1 FAD/NAD(P)-binding protein [Streptomyces qinzhouensis]QDY81483.1 FAD/NAD(P)-binding protein [Streptomyces qinzhouensis]